MTTKDALKKILAIVKDTNKKVSALQPEKFGAIDADLEKTLKAMGYQQIQEVIKEAKKQNAE